MMSVQAVARKNIGVLYCGRHCRNGHNRYISPQILRTCLARFKKELNDKNLGQDPCASCCRLKRRCKLSVVTFPAPVADDPPDWLPWDAEHWRKYRNIWYEQVDSILNVDSYLNQFFRVPERLASADKEVFAFEHDTKTPFPSSSFTTRAAAGSWRKRVLQWSSNLRRDLHADSCPAPHDANVRWLLYGRTDIASTGKSQGVTCSLCKRCRAAFSRVEREKQKPNVHVPDIARANGLWRGPDPQELSCLSYVESKVINLARIYVSVKRVFLNRGSYAGTSYSETPLYHQKNVVAFPQNPDAVLRVVGMTPQMLGAVVQVQFVGSDRTKLHNEFDLRIWIPKMRRTLKWLSMDSWPFMEITKTHDLWETDALDEPFEELLKAYASSIGGSEGVPQEIIEGAAQIPEENAGVVAAGPAQCIEEESDEKAESFGRNVSETLLECAGILDGGVDEITPVRIWDTIMKKYKLAQVCEEELKRLKGKDTQSDKARLQIEHATALAEAVEGVSKLHHRETKAKLQELVQREKAEGLALPIVHFSEFLSNRHPLFWYSGFVGLSPRGDWCERCNEQSEHLVPWRWAKALLTRADSNLWRQDVEFIASLFNIQLRREQINAVEACVRSHLFSTREQHDLAELSSSGIVATALASGDVNSVREAMRKKGLHNSVLTALQKMQAVQRTVRGSEAEKDNLLPKFFGLRLWSGCASLLFTLNPHDIRSPLTLLLLQDDFKWERTFSLDLTDDETEAIMREFMMGDPRKLHRAVVANPLAATRTFHWAVKLVIQCLFNCADSLGFSPDSIPAQELPGVFGYIRAYLGVVEPQIWKSLHVHMLTQLHGFSHPEDVFGSDVLPSVIRRVWYFVASVCFRSTEGFADYLGVASATETMQNEPLFPLTKKQRPMLGEVRVRESMAAQLAARGLSELPGSDASHYPVQYWTSTTHANATLNDSSWAKGAAQTVAASTRKTGNHVCRAEVCHKGKLGKKGFCRMMFWHWAKKFTTRKVSRQSGIMVCRSRHGGMEPARRHCILPHHCRARRPFRSSLSL